ncbi:protein Fe65 homolog [Caerostris darwini]|uniref:Protein Fe65 homolog n=1 Tax=Caerostris darwini TaxID=1538125 RepID=A0AAV4WUC5_9ARAC|nr:protein Fe65 homolog [Caerostris darwini]
MSSSVDAETDLLSYANPNYQLTSSDENCNIEIDGSYDDLYEGLDVACKINRRLSVRGRRKYASLDPVSMGVDVDLETVPMLTANTENNLNQTHGLKSSDTEDSFPGIDNGNAVFDSNDNKDMGKKSSFLDYYISLEAATSLKENKSPTFQALCSCDSSVQKPSASVVSEKLAGSTKYERHLCDESAESDCLPSGWERHEDDSGPYYWHISSGTIQRDPPISYSCNRVSSRLSKDLDLNSSKKYLYLNPRKTTCETSIPNGIHRNNMLGVHSLDEKIKRRSCPDGSCSLTSDKRPIRFAVRSLGWVEIAEADLTPERSSKAVNKCIVDLSIGRNDILDIVGRWGDGKDLFMDLDDYSLRLMDTQDLTVLNTQPIHTIRVWGVGRDNGRDFAYVARDRATKKHMCHVFRCDIPARIIANTLRDICKKIMIERSLQRSLNRHNEPSALCEGEKSNGNNGTPTRPTNLPMEQGLFYPDESLGTYVGQLFPTPMEEPKKVLKVYYLGSTNVEKATGVDVLNDAIEQLTNSIRKSDYKYVNVAVAPSTITISEPGDEDNQLAECRVRFLSFLGIGKNVKNCGFIVHTALDEFVAHVFYCEPSSGALCKTIEAACKLRYQKCLDAHRQDSDAKNLEAQRKGLRTTLKSVFGTFFSARQRKSAET